MYILRGTGADDHVIDDSLEDLQYQLQENETLETHKLSNEISTRGSIEELLMMMATMNEANDENEEGRSEEGRKEGELVPHIPVRSLYFIFSTIVLRINST